MSKTEKYPKRIVMEGYPSVSDIGLFLYDCIEITPRKFQRMDQQGIPESMHDREVPRYKLTLTRIDKKGEKQ